ncbi:MAG: hypothetical protein L6R40_004059 [Gallowayella cf. fulva]|nr:MAG: hypothetical protein L6R40_004059 [Xanthomendoza cf. fulva]
MSGHNFLGASQSTLPSSNNNGNQSSEFIDSPKALTALIDVASVLLTSPPSLYVDLCGVSLSRHGTISILQILASPENLTYLVDIYILGSKAFHTPRHRRPDNTEIHSSNPPTIPKVIFDVRRDSDAHFGIKLAGIQDLQLMEMAT